jgi:lipocalin
LRAQKFIFLLLANSVKPTTRDWVVMVKVSKNLGFWINSNVFNPAATATGLPDSVPAW